MRIATVAGRTRRMGPRHVARLMLVYGVACQSALDLERYAFEVTPLDAGSEAGPAGQADKDSGAEPSDAGCSGRDGSCSTEPEPDPGACGSCALAHARSVCSDGGCAVESCVGPWTDANGVASDGCERGDIPAQALALWLMADAGLTETRGLVSAWRDQSSNGFSASQLVTAQMPASVVSSGAPMLQFDGLDDNLRLPAGFSSFEGAGFFAVVEALPNASCAALISLSNGPGADDVEFGRHTPGVLYFEVFDVALQGVSEAFVPDRRLLVSIVQAAGGAVELRIDGVPTASGNLPLPRAVQRQQNYVGKNLYPQCPTSFDGRIGEIVFYTRGVSAEERDRVESYLADKWQL